MKVSRTERIKLELQMLTGVLTDDISYLCYLLLKDGSHFKHEREKNTELAEDNLKKIENMRTESFEEFFRRL